MLNINKFRSIITRSANLSLLNETLAGKFFNFNGTYINSLVHTSFQPFGRAKIPNKQKNKERVSAPAFSDEKVGKISKAEEEADNKKKKQEDHKAKTEKATRKVVLPKTQLSNFEYKADQAFIERESEKAKKRGYVLLDEERAPKPADAKVKTWPAVQEIARTLNDVTRKETPSLKRKVVREYFNVENHVNINYWKNLKNVPATDSTKRAGVIGFKVGMTSIWDRWGKRIAVTVIQFDRCQVTQVKTHEKEGYCALQIGAGEANLKTLTKPEIGHYVAQDVPPKQILREFHVTPENILPVGYIFSVRHFTPGQYVDCTGVTKGKGTQGAMYRWGFRGQPASHGNSLSHRALGSTGQRQDAGRVWKNKKMPGRMGANQRTVQSLRVERISNINYKVYKIDATRSLLYVTGAVPGKTGAPIFIKDAVKKITKNLDYLNCPTFIPQPGEVYADQMIMKADDIDPNEVYLHDNDVVEAGNEA